MTTYNYLLVRGEVSDHAVPGTLYINGNRVCDTLEPANCCLRAGTYKLHIVEKCDQLKTRFIQVQTPWMDKLLAEQATAEDSIEGDEELEMQIKAEKSYCKRCAEHEHQRQLCYRNFYRNLGMACENPTLSQEQLDAREQELLTIRKQAIQALGTPLPCPKITHGTGVIGLPGGTILLGELPEKIELGDKRIQLPILRNSGEHYRLFLDRITKTLRRGDVATLTIRG